jgi:hypothetical protein
VTGDGTGVVSYAELACAIADEARVISDFRMMGDQRELFRPVVSVPTAWRALREAASGGDRAREQAAIGKVPTRTSAARTRHRSAKDFPDSLAGPARARSHLPAQLIGMITKTCFLM